MEWQIPIVIALTAISFVFVIFAKSLSKEQRHLKTFFGVFALGICILIAQIGILIVKESASTQEANLLKLATSGLTITIVVFWFFISYYFIVYTIETIKGLRDAKKNT